MRSIASTISSSHTHHRRVIASHHVIASRHRITSTRASHHIPNSSSKILFACPFVGVSIAADDDGADGPPTAAFMPSARRPMAGPRRCCCGCCCGCGLLCCLPIGGNADGRSRSPGRRALLPLRWPLPLLPVLLPLCVGRSPPPSSPRTGCWAEPTTNPPDDAIVLLPAEESRP